MNTALLHTHSSLRYLVLLFLLIVIIKSVLGLVGKKSFTKLDNTFSLVLLIVTHLQLLVGLMLYFVSDKVVFGEGAMGGARYFTVEHIFGMLVAVALITVARTTSKRMTDDQAKFKRLALLNILALVVIIVVLTRGNLNILGGTAV